MGILRERAVAASFALALAMALSQPACALASDGLSAVVPSARVYIQHLAGSPWAGCAHEVLDSPPCYEEVPVDLRTYGELVAMIEWQRGVPLEWTGHDQGFVDAIVEVGPDAALPAASAFIEGHSSAVGGEDPSFSVVGTQAPVGGFGSDCGVPHVSLTYVYDWRAASGEETFPRPAGTHAFDGTDSTEPVETGAPAGGDESPRIAREAEAEQGTDDPPPVAEASAPARGSDRIPPDAGRDPSPRTPTTPLAAAVPAAAVLSCMAAAVLGVVLQKRRRRSGWRP